ncbi:integrase family protein [Ferrimonas balearica DSM 9799]|uniref:Integrase family protein n=2 Tax=Ferrimonas balearica TaxID=44012 RepID=E1SVI4_FERBD|nr:integrase family protein [Ferrimonas balearica DSM 9799]
MRALNPSKSSELPYLFQSRHGIWYARVVVPLELREALGRREFRQSLKTRCRREAVQRSWTVLDRLSQAAQGATLIEPNCKAEPQDSAVVTPRPAPRLTPRPTPKPRSKTTPLLSEVMESFIREKTLAGAWKPKEVSINRTVFAELKGVVGDLPVTQFRFEEALAYKQHFLEEGRLSASTINKKLSKVGHLMQWASVHYGAVNPMEGLAIRNARVAPRDQRKAVSERQVRQMLRLAAEQDKSFKRWLPLLGAYTGARIGELSQLYLDDFVVVEGYPCIHIRQAKPDQTLKTASSERVIPIHSQLIKAGLLQFVERQLAAGHKRLFPELRYSEVNGYGHASSMWFTKFRAKMGWGEGETFHSLRHTLVTQLKRKGFGADIVGGLVGHSTGSITFDRYGKAFLVSDLLPVVEAVEY